jgi:hypothetical protein
MNGVLVSKAAEALSVVELLLLTCLPGALSACRSTHLSM